jgi:hypothetical protein
MRKYLLLAPNGDVVGKVASDPETMAACYAKGSYREDGEFEGLPLLNLGENGSVDATESWKLSRLAFKNRFARAKWVAFMIAAQSGQNQATFDLANSISLVDYIDLKDEQVIIGVQMLGLPTVPDEYRLTEAEIDAVLNVPAREDEQP